MAVLDQAGPRSPIRLDSNDYSGHPSVIGRRIEVTADLARVRVWCSGQCAADHVRAWAKHQTISDSDRGKAAVALHHNRIAVVRRAAEPEVQIQSLSDYNARFDVPDYDGTEAL